MSAEDDLRRAVQEMEVASSRFLTGDAGPFKECWSHRDDTTIFGGLGAYEVGWEQIGPRLEWAAGRFRGGRISYEPLAVGVGGDLGYAVGIERGEARVTGEDEPAPLVLRVTHVLRREEGDWKLIHRHADPISTKTQPPAILQQREGYKEREEGEKGHVSGR